jgi:metal-responsive CopG/Arc/MetJ family transcriptional regulator
MKIQTSVMLSENLLSTIEQLSEKNKTLSDFIETALQFYITKFKRFEESSKDIEIINKNADFLNQETQDALQYQVEL